MKKTKQNDDNTKSRQQIIEEFGHRLKMLRTQLKINQKEVARRLEVSPSYISEIESGKAGPGFEFMYKLSMAYDINPLYLLTGKEPRLLKDLRALSEPAPAEVPVPASKTDYSELLKQDGMQQLFYYLERSTLVRWELLARLRNYLLSNKVNIELDMDINKSEEDKLPKSNKE